MKYQQLEDALLRRVFDAIVKLGQSRESLLTGIAPEVASSLPVSRSRAETLWSDLDQLNRMGPLDDGSVPLVTWLANGRLLAGPRMEARVLQEALDRIAARPNPAPPVHDRGGVASAQDGWGSSNGVNAPEVVVLHAQEDESFARALGVHAAVLRNTRRASLWFEGDVAWGARRDGDLLERVSRAAVVIVLLSSNFIASTTMSLAAQALAQGKRVVPVVVRACAWKGTPLGKLTALPRNEVPIAQHRSPDEAYAQVVGELRDLLDRLADAPPPARDAPDAVEAPPARSLTVNQVFPDLGPPEATYVEPSESARLLDALKRPDRGLVVDGPSTIGKTTAITRALRSLGRRFVHLFPGDPQIDTLRRPEDVKGWVVIDDFHQLNEASKTQIAHVMKWMVDRPTGDRKVVIIGVGEVARTLIALNSNLVRRFDHVQIKRQPSSKIDELLRKGEDALNITFAPREVIIALASGSFALAQQLAAQAVHQSGVVETQPRRTRVEVSRADLAEEMLGQLRLAYADAVTKLLADDRTPPRGIHLALLWRLSQREDEGVLLTDITNEFPQLLKVVDARGPDAVLAPLQQIGILAECLRVDRERVTVVDPRFSFYLRNETFGKIIRDGGLVGIAVVNPDGALELRGPGHDAGDGGAGPAGGGTPMWTVRDQDLFWPRRDVVGLLKILSDGYGTNVPSLLDIAQRAGVPPEAIAVHNRAGADVVRDVVNDARRRHVLMNLLHELRRDERVALHWTALDEMLGSGAGPAAPARG